jgi:hypothetical protein
MANGVHEVAASAARPDRARGSRLDAAVISYRHAYELVRSHGESGATTRLVPFTVDGLIWAASMVILDAHRRNLPVPALAKWSLGVGIVATIGANVAHGLNHGTIGALVSAWPALALVGSFELLMTLTRNAAATELREADVPTLEHLQPVSTEVVQTLEEAVLADCIESLKGQVDRFHSASSSADIAPGSKASRRTDHQLLGWRQSR